MSDPLTSTGQTQSDTLVRLHKAMGQLQRAMAWLLIALGAATFVVNLPMLYFIATGEVRPGEPYFLPGLAPSRWQTVSAGIMGLVSLCCGLGIRSVAPKD